MAVRDETRPTGDHDRPATTRVVPRRHTARYADRDPVNDLDMYMRHIWASFHISGIKTHI